MAGQIFVANTDGVIGADDGQTIYIRQGKTTVREGHSLLSTHGNLFSPQVVEFEFEDPATKVAPVRKADPTAPASKTSAAQAGARTR